MSDIALTGTTKNGIATLRAELDGASLEVVFDINSNDAVFAMVELVEAAPEAFTTLVEKMHQEAAKALAAQDG